MTAPRVFVSYSHDSDAHKMWVRELCGRLVASGIDVTLDQWALVPGADVVAFMNQGIAAADRVVMICSEAYVAKAEAGVGGVGYERLIVSKEIYDTVDTIKFVPIIRNNPSGPKTPGFLGVRLYIDFSDDAEFDARADELARAIHNIPAFPKPPLGPNPFSGVIPPVSIAPTLVSAGPTDWFGVQRTLAKSGLAKSERTGAMEIEFSLTGHDQWSQVALFNAIRQAEIRTFGWPIGIVLENRPEFRPKPRNDGVYAEVAISDKGFTKTKSYDYWAVRTDGAFYLLQSLFEDERAEGMLFFNTRIVRVTEALLFGHKLYSGLGLGG